ncbi:hypothetical protein Tco_1473436 [Tanacetum coccineum]
MANTRSIWNYTLSSMDWNALQDLFCSFSPLKIDFYGLVSTLEEKYDKVQQDWSALDQENKELQSLNDASSEEFKKLKVQLADVEAIVARSSDELARTDAKLSDHALVVRDLQNELTFERSKSKEYKDAVVVVDHCFDVLKDEVTHFVGFGVECFVRRLLYSDEFNSALARVLYLGISSCVERAEFDKVVAAFPSTNFPFLSKVAAAAGGALSEVVNIQPDKIVCSATPASVPAAPLSTNEAPSPSSTPREVHVQSEFHIARLNGVSPLLNFGIVLWAHSTFGSSSTQPAPSWCSLVLIPKHTLCIMLWLALSTAPFASMSTDLSLSSSTNTLFISPSHWTAANLLRASAFLFSSLGPHTLHRSIPSKSIRMSPAPDPWSLDALWVYNFHMSASSVGIMADCSYLLFDDSGASFCSENSFRPGAPSLVGSSPAIVSARKSANTWPFIAFLGAYVMP